MEKQRQMHFLNAHNILGLQGILFSFAILKPAALSGLGCKFLEQICSAHDYLLESSGYMKTRMNDILIIR